MTRTQLTAAAAVPMIALFALAFRPAPLPEPAASISAPPAPAASDASLRREIDRLRDDIADLRDDQDGLYTDLQEVAQPVGDAPVGERPETDPVQQMQAHMEHVTDTEAADPAWSRDAETRISDRFAQRAPEGAELLGLKCRATVCRVEVALGPSPAEGADDDAVAAASPWDANAFYVTEPGPNGRVVAYIAREGTVLPRP